MIVSDLKNLQEYAESITRLRSHWKVEVHLCAPQFFKPQLYEVTFKGNRWAEPYQVLSYKEAYWYLKGVYESLRQVSIYGFEPKSES